MTPNQSPGSPVGDPLIGRVLHERYRIESFLARGGMATIYRGADLRLDRTVAVKVMHPSFAADPGFVQRFQREARAAARLNSPYAVAVHDQGNDEGITYLVMEYVPGHTVRDVLRAHGPLSPARSLAIIDPVLEALAAAHSAGYVHRDVKPENVLISEDGRVKVTDFGLARAIEGADAGRTQGLLLGTVAYLSPEQVEHDRTDARSDVYSAGILLFELVTGQVPFSASAPMQVAYRHVHENVPAPSSVNPEVPAGIDALVQRATRRQPGDRFTDADAFLAAARAQRAQLPPALPWAPNPTDTLVVPRPVQLPPEAPGGVPTPHTAAPGSGIRPPAAGVAAAITPAAAAVAAAAETINPPEWVNDNDASTQAISNSRSAPEPAPATANATSASTSAADASTDQPSAVPADAAMAPVIAAVEAPADADDADRTELTEVSYQTASEESDRPRRGRRAGRWLALIALASIAGVLFMVFGPFRQVAVPNVLGESPSRAAEILAAQELEFDSSQSEYSEDYEAGVIMATDPGPDGSARIGSTVTGVVSKGPERYDVPKLRKLSVDEAEIALGAVNLVLGEPERAYHDKIAEDQIISSDPEAGASVKRDTVVTVVVSRGPEPVDMPKLVGTDGAAAETRLESLGLRVDRSDRFSETVGKGLVISTDPRAGVTTYRGEKVELVVSAGPPLVTVPNVVGKGESEAKDMLESAGFRVSVNKPLGFSVFGVNSQNPRGGTQAPKGSTVSITVV